MALTCSTTIQNQTHLASYIYHVFSCCFVFTKQPDISCVASCTKVDNEEVKKSYIKMYVIFSFNIFSMFGVRKINCRL